MHGGSKGSGAPKGNKNALKHGGYTRESLNLRADIRRLLASTGRLLKEIEDEDEGEEAEAC